MKTRLPYLSPSAGWLAVALLALGLLAGGWVGVSWMASARGAEAASAQPTNPILAELTSVGVPLEGGANLTLPPPVLPDGLDAAGQRAALESIADANHPVEALLRRSVVAPFVLKLTSEGKTAEGVGRRMDLYFIAYGDFAKVIEPGYLEERFQAEGDEEPKEGELEKKAGIFTEAELAARQLTVSKTDATEEAYGYSQFQVFDKVQVSATARVMQTRTAESVLFASLLDTRFATDTDYPNRWWPISLSDLGQPVLGEPRPYAGSGGYGKLTRLSEPAGAMFLEYHMVFNEPRDWFGGTNLIGSKLPILVQDNVRKFRRQIAKDAPAGKGK